MRKLLDGFGVVEAPRYHPAWGLLFSDMTRGGVHAYSDAGVLRTVIAHRRAVGGLVVHADGGLVITGRNVTWRCGPAGEDRIDLLAAQGHEEFFNDAWADARGRIYVGSVGRATDDGRRPPGRLYRIATDGTAEVLADDVGLSNGIAGAPDGAVVYHADTAAQVVWRYAPDAGGALRRTELCDLRDEAGAPDGLAVDEAGTVWVAMFQGATVLGVDPDGRLAARLDVPQPEVTAPCFSGPDRRTLVVATGVLEPGAGRSGALYVETVDVAGLAHGEARVRPDSISGGGAGGSPGR